MNPIAHPSRRHFLRIGSACVAHMAIMAQPFPLLARNSWSRQARGHVVARQPFGRLEEIGDGLWALISTPLGGDYTTVANGGIVAGREGVLAVEAFQTPQGARWMAERARELTGRWPTHVLVTHYHSDHTSGMAGYFDRERRRQAGDGEGPGTGAEDLGGGDPSIYVTETTRSLATRSLPADAPASVQRQWADAVLVPGDRPTSLDLGGRTVIIDPHQGHTGSDVTMEVPDDNVIWCGDLVWNGMFPNYMDAVPSQLSKAVNGIRARSWIALVPGHGPMADASDLDRYAAVILGVEEAARKARREGWTAEEAARRHHIPEHLGDWTLFNPSYIQRAMEAWMREWEGDTDPVLRCPAP